MEKRRNSFQVMAGLIGMIKPLLGVMAIAIIMGCIGNLMATFITVLGGYGLLTVMGLYKGISLSLLFGLGTIFAIFRAILRYAEQASNHYIAFKILAKIRNKVFEALRKLAPAKLDGSDKGNLISIVTSDVELLEVFYAHTISPIAIAAITSLFMIFYIGSMHPLAGVLATVFYVLVGIVIPIFNGRRGSGNGQIYRESFGDLNTIVLDNLYGLDEILQYNQKEKRMQDMANVTDYLEGISAKLKKDENTQRIATDWIILIAGVTMAVLAGGLVNNESMEVWQGIIAVIAMMSSFGPTAALSALSNNLNHTLASGNRVLDLLAEEPEVIDITEGSNSCSGPMACEKVTFGYRNTDLDVLKDFKVEFKENRIHGIHGKSGCGKSTLLKLFMRFYETNSGTIRYGSNNINEVKTSALRNHISYVTQDTFLFHDTVEMNIKVSKEDATKEEVIEAAKKASIHDFIMSLPNGYETKLSELGDSISGGEKQRIGIARAFLHKSNVIFLDEPTSNIDSLNEGIILKSLEREKENKTIILVSHRKSTMGIADNVIAM